MRCRTDIGAGLVFCATCGSIVGASGEAWGDEELRVPLEELRRDLAKDYEIEEELGRGGMAVVWRARELDLGRRVALKVLPRWSASSAMAERFRREARLAAGLEHANIIPIYRVGQAAGTCYFAMRYVEGLAVDAIIERQGPLPIAVVVQILRRTADALAFAHMHHIVHCDIKGANILVDRDGQVIVSDFGVARAFSEDASLTATRSIIGTPQFMSPEQCAGQHVGPQTDQYSLGVLGFQMLAGQLPFEGDSVVALIQHHYFSPVPDLSEVREGIPERLLDVIYRALEKDASKRYPTTQEMVKALGAVPLPPEEKARSVELLRDLARGEAIPRVRTYSLAPLPDTRTSGFAAIAAAAATLGAAPAVAPGAPRRPVTHARRARALWVTAGVVAAMAVVTGGVRLAIRGARPAALASAPKQEPSAHVGLSGAEPKALPGAPSARGPRVARTPAAHRAAVAVVSGREVLPMPEVVKERGSLRVSVVPATATIRVDGRLVGRAGTATEVKVAAGVHRVSVGAAGFRTFDTAITVRPNANVVLDGIRLLEARPTRAPSPRPPRP